jgi:hypothetical protein
MCYTQNRRYETHFYRLWDFIRWKSLESWFIKQNIPLFHIPLFLKTPCSNLKKMFIIFNFSSFFIAGNKQERSNKKKEAGNSPWVIWTASLFIMRYCYFYREDVASAYDNWRPPLGGWLHGIRLGLRKHSPPWFYSHFCILVDTWSPSSYSYAFSCASSATLPMCTTPLLAPQLTQQTLGELFYQ